MKLRYDGLPRDAPRSPNNSSEHKSSVKPEGSPAEHPRIIAKRYCLGSIDLAYKILGYRCRLHVVKSEGGPKWRRNRSLDFRWNAFLTVDSSRVDHWFNDASWLALDVHFCPRTADMNILKLKVKATDWKILNTFAQFRDVFLGKKKKKQKWQYRKCGN